MVVIDPTTLIQIGAWSRPEGTKIAFGATAGEMVAIVSDLTLILLAVTESPSVESGRTSRGATLQELQRVELESPVSALAMRLGSDFGQGADSEYIKSCLSEACLGLGIPL